MFCFELIICVVWLCVLVDSVMKMIMGLNG